MNGLKYVIENPPITRIRMQFLATQDKHAPKKKKTLISHVLHMNKELLLLRRGHLYKKMFQKRTNEFFKVYESRQTLTAGFTRKSDASSINTYNKHK